MDDQEKLKAMEEKHRKAIIDKVNLLRKRMSNINDKLGLVKSGKDDFKPSDDRPENVYYIMPDMLRDYDVLSKSSLPFMEFVACFEVWIMRLECVITLNRALLKNKTVMRHMEACLDTCQIIDHATKSYFGE